MLLRRFSCSVPSHSVHSGVLGCTLRQAAPGRLSVRRGTPPLSEGTAGVDLLNPILEQGAAAHDASSGSKHCVVVLQWLQNCTSVPTDLIWLHQPEQVRAEDLRGWLCDTLLVNVLNVQVPLPRTHGEMRKPCSNLKLPHQ